MIGWHYCIFTELITNTHEEDCNTNRYLQTYRTVAY